LACTARPFLVNVALTHWNGRSSSTSREPSLRNYDRSRLHSRRGGRAKPCRPIEAGSCSRKGGDGCRLRLKEREPRGHQILKSLRATRRHRENGDCTVSGDDHGPRRASERHIFHGRPRCPRRAYDGWAEASLLISGELGRMSVKRALGTAIRDLEVDTGG
jgi:hypothetical protein